MADYWVKIILIPISRRDVPKIRDAKRLLEAVLERDGDEWHEHSLERIAEAVVLLNRVLYRSDRDDMEGWTSGK